MCIAALVKRGEVEEGLAGISEDFNLRASRAFLEVSEELDLWVEREKLSSVFTDEERDALGLAPGGWTRRMVIDANWRIETLAVLLWALSQLDVLPGLDTMVDNLEILNRSGLFKPAVDFMMGTRLRPYSMMRAQREIAGIWRWRAHTDMLIREGRVMKGSVPINELIGQAAEELYETQGVSLPAEGDILAFGKPFSELDSEELQMVNSIAVERHFALKWLCGYVDDWGEGAMEL